MHLRWCSLIEVVSLLGLMCLSASLVLSPLSSLRKPVSTRSLGKGTLKVPLKVVVPATISKTLGAFLTLTQAYIEIVYIIAAGAVLDLLLKRIMPPDTPIECSIQLILMD